MNQEQLRRMHEDKGFIAALDQSGGSTPKALAAYGIGEDRYQNETEMFDLVHEMRKRIIKSPAFSRQYILGAILFENTMDRTVDGEYTADYLLREKGIMPFLKVDQGLAPIENGVQLMKPIPGLGELLKRAVSRNVFGTKMRSVIHAANAEGIASVVAQQFEFAKEIAAVGLVPIIEPEVDITIPDKAAAETLLKVEIQKQLDALPAKMRVMLKISIPAEDDFYGDLMHDPHMVRVVALSGGYPQAEANQRLARNHGLIASFSRALSQGLNASQSQNEFDARLARSIRAIYDASIT